MCRFLWEPGGAPGCKVASFTRRTGLGRNHTWPSHAAEVPGAFRQGNSQMPQKFKHFICVPSILFTDSPTPDGQPLLWQEQAEADEKSKELHGPTGIAQRKACQAKCITDHNGVTGEVV